MVVFPLLCYIDYRSVSGGINNEIKGLLLPTTTNAPPHLHGKFARGIDLDRQKQDFLRRFFGVEKLKKGDDILLKICLPTKETN